MAWFRRPADVPAPEPTGSSGPTVRLESADGASPFSLYLEPEGAEHHLPGGTKVLVTWPDGSHEVGVSWHADGFVIWRDVGLDNVPSVTTRDGHSLDW